LQRPVWSQRLMSLLPQVQEQQVPVIALGVLVME